MSLWLGERPVIESGSSGSVGDLIVGGTLTVAGSTELQSLQALGSATYLDTTTLATEDPIIDINRTGTAATTAGLRIITPSGSGTNRTILWDTAGGYLKAGIEGSETRVVVSGDAIVTDSITEATANAGVTVESVLLKDGTMTVSGYTIEGTDASGLEIKAPGYMEIKPTLANTGSTPGGMLSLEGGYAGSGTTGVGGDVVVQGGGTGGSQAAGHAYIYGGASTSGTSGNVYLGADGYGYNYLRGLGIIVSASGGMNVSSTNVSTSTTTGALTIGGGLGVAGAIHAGQLVARRGAGSGTTTATGMAASFGPTGTGDHVAIGNIAGKACVTAITDTTATAGAPLYLNLSTSAATRIGGGSVVCESTAPVSVLNTTASTTTGTGALTVAGGVGVAGALYGTTANFSGLVSASTVPTSGEHLCNKTYVDAATAGGGDVVGPASSTNLSIPVFDGTTGKLLKSPSTTASDRPTISQYGDVILGTASYLRTRRLDPGGGASVKISDGGGSDTASLGPFTYDFYKPMTCTDTTASSSTTTGSVILSGGVGIAGNLHVGGTITGASISGSSSSYTVGTITNVANLSGTGAVADANYTSIGNMVFFNFTVSGLTESAADTETTITFANLPTGAPISTNYQFGSACIIGNKNATGSVIASAGPSYSITWLSTGTAGVTILVSGCYQKA